jgi:hypothetical protein
MLNGSWLTVFYIKDILVKETMAMYPPKTFCLIFIAELRKEI